MLVFVCHVLLEGSGHPSHATRYSVRVPFARVSRIARGAVPVYNGLKRPKHHFMCHLAQNIFDWGPPRGYWCFGFEGYNKVIKKGGRRSNWMHESHDVMKWWAVRKARALRRTYAAVETVDS